MVKKPVLKLNLDLKTFREDNLYENNVDLSSVRY